MRRVLRLIVATGVWWIFNPSCGQAQAGSAFVALAGHVFDFEGKPLPGATISLFPLEVGVAGPMPSAISAKDGSYHLISPAFGKTRICASLQSLGYPDTRDKVFASPSDHFPEIVLARGSALDNVDIHLGPPDGQIEGSVVDTSTGESIPFARITLRWAEDPSVFMTEGIARTGIFQYALPKRPITITISAPGYQTWTYADAKSNTQYIDLDPLDHRSLKIELARISPNPESRQ